MADLVTLAEVRAHLNLGTDTAHDAELTLYIDAVTAHAEDRYGTIDPAPADLKLAALEDIRGLFQPSQIGPPGAFLGVSDVETGPAFRPIRLWPRVDAWLERATRTARGVAYAFPDAVGWPDAVENQT